MKKFYKVAEAGTAPGGYVVRLDGKPVKTPLDKPLLLPSMSLAEAVAEEWRDQGDDLQPASMPVTRLANAMIDKAKGAARAEMNEKLLEYGGADLVCYFAAHPADLAGRQKKLWLPLIAWMKETHGVCFETVSGIRYHHQPRESLDGLKKLLETLDAADFTVVQAAAAATGSVVIALALLFNRVPPEEAWQAACADEIYQLATWGADAAAQRRLDIIRSELKSIVRFRDLVRG